MNNEPAENTEAATQPETSAPGGKKKKKKIVRKIILILLAVIVLVLLGGYTYWVIKGSRLDLPYGLKAGMTLDELRQTMQDHGFVERKIDSKQGKRIELERDGEKKEFYSQASDTVDYVPTALFDVTPDTVQLEKREKSIRLEYSFDTQNSDDRIREEKDLDGNGVEYTRTYYLKNSGELLMVYQKDGSLSKYVYSNITGKDGAVYDKDHPTPAFEHILSELKALYGNPAKNMVNGHPRYDWTGIRMNFDRYEISLYFYNDTGYVVNYTWDKSGIF